MDMLQVFHMNKGEGEASYAKNCIVQNKIISMTKPFVEEAVRGYLGTDLPETVAVADLGCSSGPTALRAVSEITEAVHEECRRRLGRARDGGRWAPKFMVFLNDLPKNDFNEVFASLSDFHRLRQEKAEGVGDVGPCFIAGLPGSFYGRLLPNNTLHFVHCSSSLHWLSQVPPGLGARENPEAKNKGKIYLSKTSPRYVIEEYLEQFQKDFLLFIKSRSEEVISGGRMVLTMMGRTSTDPTCDEGCYPWELIAHSLMSMVSEGLIEEEKVDTLNVPYYAPCVEEIKQVIEGEGSFVMASYHPFEVDWDGGEKLSQDDFASSSCRGERLINATRGERVAKTHRAVIEPMMEHHFGSEVLDELFLRYSKIVDDHLSKQDSKFVNLVISLIRK